jgi:general secretion pathway protein D
MRIIPNNQNNAILIYGSPQESTAVEAMLHKIDILPLQVEIDATIAEVTLNDTLQYGTQWFFKSRGVNITSRQYLTSVPPSGGCPASLSGLVGGGSGAGSAPLCPALRAVKKVSVLSSPAARH